MRYLAMVLRMRRPLSSCPRMQVEMNRQQESGHGIMRYCAHHRVITMLGTVNKYFSDICTINLILKTFLLKRQKEPQKLVIRGRCRSSATLGHGNMASDVAELRRQSPGYQYQSQWIHPDMSLEQPDTPNQPRTAARVTDGEIMNIL